MNLTHLSIRSYFKTLSAIAPKTAASQAAKLFQRPQKRKLRAPEKLFYAEYKSARIEYDEGSYYTFEWGSPQGELVILVHGWNSNAGSMAGIGHRLARKGYRVMAIDLPGHGLSVSSTTNLVRMASALEHLLVSLNGQSFSIVSHSMGSAVSSYALKNTGLAATSLIFLTSPNTLTAIFEEYRDTIGLSQRAYLHLVKRVEAILGESLEDASVPGFLNDSAYDRLLLIHDRTDRVIGFEKAVEIYDQTTRSRYLPLEQMGHYRMLWTEEVIDIVEDEMEGHLAPRYGFASLDYRNKARK